MSKDEKRTQRGPGGFEDKIDAAMETWKWIW